MQEHADRELFVKQLKEMLDWYTFHAPDNEYDESNVENILKLLDSFDPIGEEDLPHRDAAWERFRQMAEERIPNSDSFALENSLGRTDRKPDSFALGDVENTEAGSSESVVGGIRCPAPEDGEAAAKEHLEANVETAGLSGDFHGTNSGEAKASGTPVSHRSVAKFGAFVMRHKYIAAAVLVLLILAVSGTAQAIATQGSDFFFWLKRDESGTEMMISPEGLDGVMETKKVEQYEKIEDLPDWAQEWAYIAEGVELPEGYEFQYFEMSDLDYYQGIVGHYMDFTINAEILLGVWKYYGKLSYNGEDFIEYNYVRSYEMGETQMDIFNRTQENGNIYYAICFYKGNYQYLVKGQDDLDEVKELAEQYLDCILINDIF